jgi:hypothetical protein
MDDLQELERMAAKLEHTARKLPPGPNLAELLQDIDRFRAQLTSRLVELGPKAKGKGQ